MKSTTASTAFESFVRSRIEETEKSILKDSRYRKNTQKKEDIIHTLENILGECNQSNLLKELLESQYEIDDCIYQSIYIQGMRDAQELPIFPAKKPKLRKVGNI